MTVLSELEQAFKDHRRRTGNQPHTMRIHEQLWNELGYELEHNAMLRDAEQSEDKPLTFYGAKVTLVSDINNPEGFFRWSIQ